MGRGHPPSKAGRHRVLGNAARLLQLSEPVDRRTVRPAAWRRVDGAAAPLAGAVGRRDPARASNVARIEGVRPLFSFSVSESHRSKLAPLTENEKRGSHPLFTGGNKCHVVVDSVSSCEWSIRRGAHKVRYPAAGVWCSSTPALRGLSSKERLPAAVTRLPDTAHGQLSTRAMHLR